jgi:hypothetical protein
MVGRVAGNLLASRVDAVMLVTARRFYPATARTSDGGVS